MTDTPAPTLRRLRLAEATEAERRALTDRASTATPDIRARARAIVDGIRAGGDAALRDANRHFGGGLTEPADAPALRVPGRSWRRPAIALPDDLRAGLEQMARNIEAFHAVEVPPPRNGWRPSRVSRWVASGVASIAWPPTSPAAPRPTPRPC